MLSEAFKPLKGDALYIQRDLLLLQASLFCIELDPGRLETLFDIYPMPDPLIRR